MTFTSRSRLRSGGLTVFYTGSDVSMSLLVVYLTPSFAGPPLNECSSFPVGKAFALAWWSSGKARPPGRRTARAFSPAERQMRIESEGKRRGGAGTGIGGYGGGMGL